MEKEKAENSGLVQSNAEEKLVWNWSCTGDSAIRPVIGASAWPGLSETKKASLSDKSSSDLLKSLGDGSSSSSSVPFYEKDEILAEALAFTEQLKQSMHEWTFESASSTNGNVAQPSGQSSFGYSESPFQRGQNQRKEFASQSHDGAQNEYQRNSNKNQNGNQHPHQSHGGRRNQNWNPHINFNGRGGIAQPQRGIPGGGFAPPPRGIQGFIRPPAPPIPPIYAYYVPPQHLFYPFSGPMVFPEWGPWLMYNPHHDMPFIEPPPYELLQDSSLATKIRDQVHYYFSEKNLRTDEFLCKRMDDEGFVHIQFIAGFKKLRALTDNIQLIVDALQGSNVVELQGYEIRNRNNWREFLKPPNLRITFYPSPDYATTRNIQNSSLKPKADEIRSSSSN